MKLYFYCLSQPPGERPRIEVEECEVEERPKTYKPVDKLPSYYCGFYVTKNEIGRLLEDTIILTERDSERVAKIFIDDLHGNIAWNRSRIKDLKKEIAKTYDLIDMVDDWRLEHESN